MSERISELAALPLRLPDNTISLSQANKLTVFTLTSSAMASPCSTADSTTCNKRQPKTQARDASPASFAKGVPKRSPASHCNAFPARCWNISFLQTSNCHVLFGSRASLQLVFLFLNRAHNNITSNYCMCWRSTPVELAA